MALKMRMKVNEMVYFIDHELLPQVENEIGHWIHPEKKHDGYFVTTRQIFCMIDFLGAVYSGYSKKERQNDKKEGKERIATTDKAKNYIARYFTPKTTYDQNTINNLYAIYRHGLVHLYQPRVLKYNTRKSLQWFFYRGNNRFYKTMPMDTPQGRIIFKNVAYLQVLIQNPSKKYYYFPIGIDSLYHDFVDSVKQYKEELITRKSLQTKWRTTVNAICTPK